MSDRVIELFRTMAAERLEEELQAAASLTGMAPLPKDDLQHLSQVLTSQPLVSTPLTELIRQLEPVDSQLAHALRLLAASQVDADSMHRLLAVPDHMRSIGDKCLFETGIARTTAPRGLDIEELGRRSYERAARILESLGDDRRLRRFYEENALDRKSLEDEVRLLARCSDMFAHHARLLSVLVHAGDSARRVVGSPEAPEAATAPNIAAREASTALTRHAASPARKRHEDADEPQRVADLHVVSRTEEENAEERIRELILAEKTVLFSMLDPELLRTELKRVVIHQDAAIDQLCDEICLYSTGTQDPRKPASYFLVGPTGVGKNYVVESLIRLFERLWGIEVPYLELEGPEFTYPSDINELKGAARGFIRSDEEGIMTKFHERAHDKPFSVILVDEVEKSHPQLRRFFLPIMDRGVMTDNRGRVLHFANTTIFFTSNIGYSDAQSSTAPIGFGDDLDKRRVVGQLIDASLKKGLSPEFVNRVHVVHFAHLTREAIDDIFDLEVAKIRKRYRAAQDMDIEITPGARAELLKRGYHPDYGARNLAKILNRWINIEVSKTIKRDEARHSSDTTPVLAMLREMREGKRAFDRDQVDEAVRACARAQVPYTIVTIDCEGGDLVYRRG